MISRSAFFDAFRRPLPPSSPGSTPATVASSPANVRVAVDPPYVQSTAEGSTRRVWCKGALAASLTLRCADFIADQVCTSGEVDCGAIDAACTTRGITTLQRIGSVREMVDPHVEAGALALVSYQVQGLAWDEALGRLYCGIWSIEDGAWHLFSSTPEDPVNTSTLEISVEDLPPWEGQRLSLFVATSRLLFANGGAELLRLDLPHAAVQHGVLYSGSGFTPRGGMAYRADAGIVYTLALQFEPDGLRIDLNGFGAGAYNPDHFLGRVMGTIPTHIPNPSGANWIVGTAVWSSPTTAWLPIQSSAGEQQQELLRIDVQGGTLYDDFEYGTLWVGAKLEATPSPDMLTAIADHMQQPLKNLRFQLFQYDPRLNALLFKVEPKKYSDLAILQTGIVAVSLETGEVTKIVTIQDFAVLYGFPCDAHELIAKAWDDDSLRTRLDQLRWEIDLQDLVLTADGYLARGVDALYRLTLPTSLTR